MHGLEDLRVVEACTQIAGPYCGKLFADAGAEVIKLEGPGGDPMRRWSASGRDPGGRDGPFFRYLNGGKRSVVGEIGAWASDEEVGPLLAGADLLIEMEAPAALERDALRARFPGLVILSITPFGLTGPLAGRAATDFTIQAEGASTGARGLPGGEPYQAGGRLSEWAAGSFGAVPALAAVRRARRTGQGEHIDFSMQAVTALITNCYIDLMWGILGRPPAEGAFPSIEMPSVEPTRDGYVGFTTYSAQQFSDFLLLIERPDLRESGEFDQISQRMARLDEWQAIVHAYTTRHDTAEIIERAQLLRIPVAPVNDGRKVLEHEQLLARDTFVEDPAGGARQPRPPYRIDGEGPRFPRPAPALGADQGRIEPRVPPRGEGDGAARRPLEGMKIVDVTSWWAGPIATQMLSLLGADVIHVESVQHYDGARSVGGTLSMLHEDWWEASIVFLSANANKRGITLDLSRPEGIEVLEKLIEGADALVENFSPRVMDGFGISWGRVQAINPRCHYVRMPAFGLDGPWREHVGFASTMEQMSGMAWVTGHEADQPRVQRGPCDPLAGMHAAFALLVAMAERDITGRGHFVECAMLEAALNLTAEQVIEYSAHGHVMGRRGNRSAEAAPQGLYMCAGHETRLDPQWLALSIASAAQWRGLISWLGDPEWAKGVGEDLASRRAAEDRLDAELREAFADRDLAECIDGLAALGVPVARVRDPRTLALHPQFVSRGFLEEVDHAVVGRQSVMSAPFRCATVEHWLDRAAPLLGEHNHEVLRELGYDDAEITRLAEGNVIGSRPEGC